MRFTDLQDNLRAHIWARIHCGDLTGSGLSRDAGFSASPTCRISSTPVAALALRRWIASYEVLQVDILDLADAEELRLRALQRPERSSAFDSVPLVSLHDAALAVRISPRRAREWLKFKKRFLHRLKPDTIGERDDWLRFVLAKAAIDNTRAMASRLARGAVVLLDRHYNSLLPYHRGVPNIYAVWTGTQRAIRYVSVSSGRIILQPDSRGWPVELVEIAHGKGFAEYIVGRVCHIAVQV